MEKKEEQRLTKMLEIENSLKSEGYKLICGIDEAGRGPLCGPVVAAAVILKDGVLIEGVNDSKKLSEKKREELYDKIVKNALAIGIGISDVDIIDKANILNATKLAMADAVKNLKINPDYVLIDGNQSVLQILFPQKTIVKGDSTSLSIACASIIAKVTRDRLLIAYDEKYPMYGFKKHKGYGTKMHIEAIKKYGLTDIHRPSFCKKFI